MDPNDNVGGGLRDLPLLDAAYRLWINRSDLDKAEGIRLKRIYVMGDEDDEQRAAGRLKKLKPSEDDYRILSAVVRAANLDRYQVSSPTEINRVREEHPGFSEETYRRVAVKLQWMALY